MDGPALAGYNTAVPPPLLVGDSPAYVPGLPLSLSVPPPLPVHPVKNFRNFPAPPPFAAGSTASYSLLPPSLASSSFGSLVSFGKEIPPHSAAPASHVILVGFEHAARLGQALRSLADPAVPVQTVRLNSWSAAALGQAAETLSGLLANISRSGASAASCAIIFWLHDEVAFVQADLEGGAPLSAADDQRLHCLGRLGTASTEEMKQAWDLTRPILSFAGSRRTVLPTVILSPLPLYLASSCCPNPAHCWRREDPAAAEQLCTAVADLCERMDEWSGASLPGRVRVLCPHLELLRCARKSRARRLNHLLRQYRSDGIHLRGSAYAELAGRIWSLLMEERTTT